MKFLLPVPFCGGWFNAIRSIVPGLFGHVPCRCVNSFDAIVGIRDTRSGLCQQDLLKLHRRSQQTTVQQEWDFGLWLHMRKKRLQGVIAVAIGLLALPARGQELDVAWFKANYLPAAQKLDKAYSECSAKVLVTNTSDKSHDFVKTTYQFAFDGTRRKLERTTESHKDGSIEGFSRTFVASPEVSFKVLTRREQAPLLESVNRSSMGFAQVTSRIDEQASDSIYAPFALLGQRVPSWIKHKGFEIKSIKREADRVRLDFHYKDDDQDNNGWVAFLPNRQWVIDGWDVALKMNIGRPNEYSARYVSSLSYGRDGPVPAMTGMTMAIHLPNREDSEKTVVEELTFAKVPASAFQLSAYGYDNRIASPTSIGKSLWFWLAIAAALCLLTAFGIRMRYKHAI